MKINKIYIPLALSSAVAFGVLIGGALMRGNGSTPLMNASGKNKLFKLIDLIDREYVDHINTDSIVDLTVNGILEKLDPHSVYIAKSEMAGVEESMKGEFVGIGVNFYMYKDSVAVIKTVENGPAIKYGIKAGDRILQAGNTKLYGKKLPSDSLFKYLKGEKGSTVDLKIYRKTDKKIHNIHLKRDIVPIVSVDVSLKLTDSLGYIKINRFAENTYTEFKTALTQLKAAGATQLVLDLRDNSGGYMEMADLIADDFLPQGQVIVSTKNKTGKIEKTIATKGGLFETGKLYVLINENSASASEILAGAIQDNDRGILVGRRSFGKGLVQKEIALGDGSAVRLTVARYYTPSGRSIQKPYTDGLEEYNNEFERRFNSGELYAADSIKVADSLKFKTKKGRTVYGGGGIIPDRFVPLQGAHGEDAIQMIMQSGLVSYFVFEQIDQNRSSLSKLTVKDIQSKVQQTNLYYNNFITYLSKSGLVFNLDKHQQLVKTYLGAEFIRQLVSEKEYYKIILSQDPMLQKCK